MWLRRLVHRYGVVGGGSALIGWVVSECLGVRNGVVSGLFGEALTCGLTGGAIGAGMNLVACRNGASRVELAGRAAAGLATGAFAGAIGISVGHALLGTLSGSRALGWAMGGGIGAAEGLYERSPMMLRQGLIAAAAGGLAGGLPFGLVYSLLSPLSEAGSRAIAFVLFGSCVGAAIGLAEAAFANAWLTVVEGHQTGSQIPLSVRTIILGRAIGATLRFSKPNDTEIEREHVRIVRQPDGRFALEDMHSRHGTCINQRRILNRVLLNDGDTIRIGAHSIRFDHRKQRPALIEKSNGPVVSPTPAVQAKPTPAVQAKPTLVAPAKPTPVALAKPTLVAPAKPTPVAPAKPTPIASKPAQPTVTSAAKRQPTVMSNCPKCNRPVPGTRPYCIICDLSF